MAKLLIVDDEEKLRAVLKKYAIFDGHEVIEAENGMVAIEKAIHENPDLIIMDVMMPELDGFSAVREIRKTKRTPVLMLSARGEEYDKLHGFELGIDDYVVKPFSSKEVMMRISAILNRSGPQTIEKNTNSFIKDKLKVDLTARKVLIDNIEIALSPKEYSLLFFFVENKDIAITREKLITEVWGYDYYGDDRTIDTHIKLLRQSLGEYGKLIVTLRGVGYRFEGGI